MILHFNDVWKFWIVKSLSDWCFRTWGRQNRKSALNDVCYVRGVVVVGEWSYTKRNAVWGGRLTLNPRTRAIIQHGEAQVILKLTIFHDFDLFSVLMLRSITLYVWDISLFFIWIRCCFLMIKWKMEKLTYIRSNILRSLIEISHYNLYDFWGMRNGLWYNGLGTNSYDDFIVLHC